MSRTDHDELEREAQRLLQLRQWGDARLVLTRLAHAHPASTAHRARLAYARGWEAADAGELDRARAEWTRALVLDGSLADAQAALDQHPAGTMQRFRRWVRGTRNGQ